MNDVTRTQVMEMEAGPEMDALVAERLFAGSVDRDAGLAWVGTRQAYSGAVRLPRWSRAWDRVESMVLGALPAFSTAIEPAWAVVEALRVRHLNVVLNDGTRHPLAYEIQAGLDENGPWTFCAFEMEGGINGRCARASTAPLAICRAALLTTLDETAYSEGRKFLDGSRVEDGRLRPKGEPPLGFILLDGKP